MKSLRSYLHKDILLIILFSFILRILFINFDLPFCFYPDEDYLIYHSLKFGTGDLNPHWFIWPALFEYTLFFLYVLLFIGGKIIGIFNSPVDFLYAYLKDPTIFFIIARTLVAILGTFTVYFLYKFTSALYSKRIALIVGILLAINPLHVEYSHYSVVDIPLCFMLSLWLCSSINLFKGIINVKNVMISGFVLGLATATKYPAIIFSSIIALIILKNFIHKDIKNLLKFIGIFYGFALVGFFIGSPFCFLDFSKFLSDLKDQIICSKVGWSGWENFNAFIYQFINLKNSLGWVLLILCMGGIFLSFKQKDFKAIVIVVSITIYYLIFGSSKLIYSRYILPILLFLLMFAAFCLYYIKRISKFLFIGIFLMSIIPPLMSTVSILNVLSLPDTRILANNWIEKNIPKGAKILLDVHGPPLRQAPSKILENLKMKKEKYFYHRKRNLFYQIKAKISQNSVWYDITYIHFPIGYMENKPQYEKSIQETINNLINYSKFDYVILTDCQWDKFFWKSTPSKYRVYKEFFAKFKKVKPYKIFSPSSKIKGPSIFIYKITSSCGK